MSAKKDSKTGKWYAKFSYQDWQGITRWTTKRGFETKREAQQYESEFRLHIAGDLDMTFAEFNKLYQQEHFPRIRPSTAASKVFIINNKILPYFAKKKIVEIDATDIIKWQNVLLTTVNPKTGKVYASTYLKSIHNQMSAIMNYAVRYYHLKENPVEKAGCIGKKNSGEMKFWSKEEYLSFSEAAMNEPLAFYCFEMLYWCGIREGELLALTYKDFDFETKTVSITKTYQVIDGKEFIGPPKTEKGKRVVQMPDKLAEEIEDYFHSFMDSTVGRAFPVGKNYLIDKMVKYSKKAGVKRIRIHDLRHSHISLLIKMGYSAVDIANRVGHENITITYRYAHMFPSAQTDMAKNLNNLMEGNDDVSKDK